MGQDLQVLVLVLDFLETLDLLTLELLDYRPHVPRKKTLLTLFVRLLQVLAQLLVAVDQFDYVLLQPLVLRTHFC